MIKKIEIIPPHSAVAVALKKGDRLMITDVLGEQVCDLICYNPEDMNEHLSSGRTIDHGGTIFLTKGDNFYSNRNKVMFRMVEDTYGRHNFLLTPYERSYENLAEALKPFGISDDSIPTCLNIFMHVAVNGNTGRIHLLPSISKAGDYVVIEAEMDLIVGMTACFEGKTTNFSFKPIAYQIQSKITAGDLVEYYKT